MSVSSPAAESVLSDHLYYRLHAEAERARWLLSEIPFDRIDRTRVSPALRQQVFEQRFIRVGVEARVSGKVVAKGTLTGVTGALLHPNAPPH